MNRLALIAAVALLALRAGATETVGIIAVGDPPQGPDADLAELVHQLRAACRDRVAGVEEVAVMRGRLLGELSDANLSELDRAYGGALAVYQNGEFQSSARTLRAIVEDLESLPESAESYFQWKRALLRLAHAAMSVEDWTEMQAAFGKLARTEITLQPDADQFSPGFRRRFEEVKAKVRQLPRRRLTVISEGRPGTVYLNGRQMGTTPITLTLPTGAYRVGGASGTLRVPSFRVDLDTEDRTVVLDFVLAESIRINAGPGLALAPEVRSYGIIRAGAWLGADKLIVVSRTMEGQAPFLLGSIYDVRRGTLLREGQVRMVAGAVPGANLGALASFLLTGQASRDVKGIDAQRRVVPDVASAAPVPPAAPTVAPLAQDGVATALVPPTDTIPRPTEYSPPPIVVPNPGPIPVPKATRSPPAPGARADAAPPAPAPRPEGRPLSGPFSKPVPTVSALPPAASAPAPAPSPAPHPPIASAPPATAPPATAAVSVSAAPPEAPPSTTSAPPATSAAPSLVPPTPRVARAEPADLRLTVTPPAGDHAARGSSWKGRVAVGLGALALTATGFTIYEAQRSSTASSQARGMLGPTGAVKSGLDPSAYYAARDRADSARRTAFVSAGVSAALSVGAAVLGWQAWTDGQSAGVRTTF